MPQAVLVAQAAAAKSTCNMTKNWLILADSQNIGQQLAEQLRSIGHNCTIVFPGTKYQQITAQEFRIDLANAAHFQQLCKAVPSVQKVVHLWALDAPPPQAGSDLAVASKVSCSSTLYLVQALVENYSEPPSLWLITQGAQAVGVVSGVPGLAQSSLWGMGKVIAQEHPELNCVCVDLDPKAPDAARVILEEITSATSEDQVAFRDGTRYVARLVRSKPPASWLRSESFRLEGSELGTLDIGKVEIQELHGYSKAGAQDNSGDFLHNALLFATPAQRPLLLESRLREQVARILRFSPTKLDRQESLINLGLDSLVAIELKNRINNEMGVNLPVIKIMEGASISQLAELMLSQLALAEIITSASPSTELDDDMEEGSL